MKGYKMSRKLHYIKNAFVTVTPSVYGAFGAGYISYVKKTVREYYGKRHVITIYTIIIYKYIFLLIFNVTNVTPLVSRSITGLARLRYNVTSWLLFRRLM